MKGTLELYNMDSTTILNTEIYQHYNVLLRLIIQTNMLQIIKANIKKKKCQYSFFHKLDSIQYPDNLVALTFESIRGIIMSIYFLNA